MTHKQEGVFAIIAAFFVEEDYAGATRYFDATMGQQLPEKRLAEIWQQLLSQADSFVDILETRNTIVQGSRGLWGCCGLF